MQRLQHDSFDSLHSHAPVVNFQREKILQISMVVRDAERVAKRFGDIFSASWSFYEFRPKQVILHGTPQVGDCVLKLAIGTCGGQSFKLVQPVSGPSSYMEFLQKQGEGFYSIGLGPLHNHDSIVDALINADVGIEMQGDVGNGSRFTILETVDDLACRVEITSVPQTRNSSHLRKTGSFMPPKVGIVDMDLPVISGGRRFHHIGLVVEDEKRVAHRYQELLGIGGWEFQRVPFTNYAMYGRPLEKADLASTEVGIANTYVGDMHIELQAPVELKPGGIHRVFLDKHGNGFQHLQIRPIAAGDHDWLIEALSKEGFNKEFETTLYQSGKPFATIEYIGMQDQLGGFVLELVVLEGSMEQYADFVKAGAKQ